MKTNVKSRGQGHLLTSSWDLEGLHGVPVYNQYRHLCVWSCLVNSQGSVKCGYACVSLALWYH